MLYCFYIGLLFLLFMALFLVLFFAIVFAFSYFSFEYWVSPKETEILEKQKELDQLNNKYKEIIKNYILSRVIIRHGGFSDVNIVLNNIFSHPYTIEDSNNGIVTFKINPKEECLICLAADVLDEIRPIAVKYVFELKE